MRAMVALRTAAALTPLTVTALALAGLVFTGLVLTGCAAPPTDLGSSGAAPSSTGPGASDEAMPPEEGGQPTAGDLAWLVGAWRQDEVGAVTNWEVWRRTDAGLVAEAWQASRGITRQTERLELELTLDGWVLTPVFFDEFEREERSDPFPLAAWGRGWVRFENPEHRTPHTIAYRRTNAGLEAWLVSASDAGAPKRTVFRFVPMED